LAAAAAALPPLDKQADRYRKTLALLGVRRTSLDVPASPQQPQPTTPRLAARGGSGAEDGELEVVD
jgi:hypothetical protein